MVGSVNGKITCHKNIAQYEMRSHTHMPPGTQSFLFSSHRITPKRNFDLIRKPILLMVEADKQISFLNAIENSLGHWTLFQLCGCEGRGGSGVVGVNELSARISCFLCMRWNWSADGWWFLDALLTLSSIVSAINDTWQYQTMKCLYSERLHTFRAFCVMFGYQ